MQIVSELADSGFGRGQFSMQTPPRIQISRLIESTIMAQLAWQNSVEKTTEGMSQAERIAAGKAKGKIALAPNKPKPPAFDEQIRTEVLKAQQAFTERHFSIAVDGVLRRTLEEWVELNDDSSVLFFRLTPLVGG